MYSLLNQMSENIQEGSRKELYRLLNESNQYDVSISGSTTRVFIDKDGKEIIDFASGNYLGFDKRQASLLPGAIQAVEKYGLHTGRARLTGSFDICHRLEERLATFTHSENALIVTNTFLGSIGIIPSLIEKNDLVIMDKSAHATMFHGAQLARDKGAYLESYAHNDFNHLEDILKKNKKSRHKMICLDGVYSITGNYIKLHELQQLARKYDAILFIDDAHGFGLLGKVEDDENGYGDGSGIIRHLNGNYENVLYIAGTAKNMASALAFACVSDELKKTMLAFSKPLDYSQQPIPFAFGLLNSALDLLDDEGHVIKKDLSMKTRHLIQGLEGCGFETFSMNEFPIVSVKIENTEKLIDFSRKLYDKYGLYVTSCPYPTMQKGSECIRLTVTAHNTMEQISHVIEAFSSNKNEIL